MMLAEVQTTLGLATVDLDDDVVLDLEPGTLPERPQPATGLPLTVSANQHGSRIVVLVARRPPILISDDAGSTWRESGAGLPPGVDIAISPEHPDLVLYASSERLYLSRDGGRFWHVLTLELQGIERVAWMSERSGGAPEHD